MANNKPNEIGRTSLWWIIIPCHHIMYVLFILLSYTLYLLDYVIDISLVDVVDDHLLGNRTRLVWLVISVGHLQRSHRVAARWHRIASGASHRCWYSWCQAMWSSPVLDVSLVEVVWSFSLYECGVERARTLRLCRNRQCPCARICACSQ